MAIAQDTFVKAVSSASTDTTVTSPITVASTAGRVMLIFAYGGYQMGNNISGVTVDGNAATRVADEFWNTPNTYISVFKYMAPPSGTYNVVVTASSAPNNFVWNRLSMMAVVVNGANDTDIDGYGTNGRTTTTTPSVTFTVGAANSVAYLFISGEGGVSSAGTNSTYVQDVSDAGASTMLRSNPYAISSSGSFTIGGTFSSNNQWGAIAVSIAPAAGATVNSDFLMFM